MKRIDRLQLKRILWACIFVVAGCQSGPPRQENFYRLAPQIDKSAGDRQSCGTVLVSRLETRGFSGGRAIVFRQRKDPFQVQRYHLHRWTEPPALMIQDAIVRILRSARLFRYVITPAERSSADWVVSGVLHRIEHLPENSPAKIVLEAELAVAATKTRRTIFLQRYRMTETATTKGVDAAVKSFNSALDELLGRFVTDLSSTLSRSREQCE